MANGIHLCILFEVYIYVYYRTSVAKVWFLLKKKLQVMSLPYSGGVDKDTYFGVCEKLAVSSVNYLVAGIVQLERGCKLFKVDLLRSYKQFYIDPVNSPLMGFTCKGLFYFDCTPSMGSRSLGGRTT